MRKRHFFLPYMFKLLDTKNMPWANEKKIHQPRTIWMSKQKWGKTRREAETAVMNCCRTWWPSWRGTLEPPVSWAFNKMGQRSWKLLHVDVSPQAITWIDASRGHHGDFVSDKFLNTTRDMYRKGFCIPSRFRCVVPLSLQDKTTEMAEWVCWCQWSYTLSYRTIGRFVITNRDISNYHPIS